MVETHLFKSSITCFVPFADSVSLHSTLTELAGQQSVSKIFIIGGSISDYGSYGVPVGHIKVDFFRSSEAVKSISELSETPFALIYFKEGPLKLGALSLERMSRVVHDTGCGMVYANHYRMVNGKKLIWPVIDYQVGSLRDDFDFGLLLLYSSTALRESVSRLSESYRFAGFYDLRLKLSQKHEIIRIPELIYVEEEADTRLSGQKQFDYVDPRNRAVQIEMELACTQHLKDIGSFLEAGFIEPSLEEGSFPVEASVVIPVKDRINTIEDAVRSVLSQSTDFSFNVIVVDNHSTDGTTLLLQNIAKEDPRLVHHIPSRNDLGIGGCWNEALFHPKCGRFVIQLDSDDLYINDAVVSTIVKKFYEEKCAMLIGSYEMVDFNLQSIPPGLIDHKEWTPENGPNNALRINGLGAPRAFYTPIIREVQFPNVSYGEDYAVGLAISRKYKVGRIYEALYLCRRWDGNSDAALDVEKMNAHNLYKDRIRSIEVMARKNMDRQLQ
jgi:hypothetical protein